jgi:hypothetical protein
VKTYGRIGEATDGACALHAGYLQLQTHSLGICSTYCFSTTTKVARTRLNVTFILALPIAYAYFVCIMRVRCSDLVQSMKHIIKSVSSFLVIVIFSSIHFLLAL